MLWNYSSFFHPSSSGGRKGLLLTGLFSLSEEDWSGKANSINDMLVRMADGTHPLCIFLANFATQCCTFKSMQRLALLEQRTYSVAKGYCPGMVVYPEKKSSSIRSLM